MSRERGASWALRPGSSRVGAGAGDPGRKPGAGHPPPPPSALPTALPGILSVERGLRGGQGACRGRVLFPHLPARLSLGLFLSEASDPLRPPCASREAAGQPAGQRGAPGLALPGSPQGRAPAVTPRCGALLHPVPSVPPTAGGSVLRARKGVSPSPSGGPDLQGSRCWTERHRGSATAAARPERRGDPGRWGRSPPGVRVGETEAGMEGLTGWPPAAPPLPALLLHE